MNTYREKKSHICFQHLILSLFQLSNAVEKLFLFIYVMFYWFMKCICQMGC